MGEHVKCKKCGREQFIVDELRTGYYPPNPMPPMKVDGKTEMTHKTFFKCSYCGEGFPVSVDEIGESVTLTLEIKEVKPHDEGRSQTNS